MLNKSQRRKVLVTGGSSGIGKSIVNSLATQEYSVFTCSKQYNKLLHIKDKMASKGLEIFPFNVDLRNEDSIKKMFEEIRNKYGGIDILINSAGIGYNAPLVDSKTHLWREMLDVNILGLCICTREALKDMKTNGDIGHIVNISSLSGHRVYKEGGVYAATKFSVTAITESLRLELRNLGSKIKITQISPGLVKTNFHKNYYNDEATVNDIFSEFEPLSGDDIARAVSYVLSQPQNVQVHDDRMARHDALYAQRLRHQL